MAKVGTSLSQRGLAAHLGRSVSWVSKQGNLVKGYALDFPMARSSHREWWERREYSDGRLIGYWLIQKFEARPRHLQARKLAEQQIWVGLNSKGQIGAIWYKGRSLQPFKRWQKAVIGLGMKPVLCLIRSKA